MADIKDMSREEIEQYLANMPKDTTEPSAEQETTAAETMRGADGNYDVSKINLSKMFVDKANEHGYTDNETGEKKSYNKGSKWQAYIDKNIIDPAAKADMEKQIYDLISTNPNMSDKELKFRLRAIQSNLVRRYPNGVSKKFDISGGMFDRTMAKELLKLGLKGEQKPAETKQPDTATPPAAETPKSETPKSETPLAAEQKPAEQKPAEQKSPTTNDDLNTAFKRIKNKQASDADLALFSKYSEEQLKKMGFGPISIAAIKSKKKTVQPAEEVPSEEVPSGNSAEEAPVVNNTTTKKAGEALSKGRTYKMGIGSAATYYVDGKQVDKVTYDKAVAEDKAAKKAVKKTDGKTPQQQMLDKYHEHH